MDTLHLFWKEFSNLDKASMITIISIIVTVASIIVAIILRQKKQQKVTTNYYINTLGGNVFIITDNEQLDLVIERLHQKGFYDYVDSINETISKYLVGNPPLETRHFNHMKATAESLIKEYGISIEDAEILAVINFCQDVRMQAEGRKGYTMDGNYDEVVLKLLKKLSEKAKGPLSEETKKLIELGMDPRDKYVGKWTYEHSEGSVSLFDDKGKMVDWIDNVSGGRGEVFISKVGAKYLEIGDLLFELNGNVLFREDEIGSDEFNFHIIKSLTVQLTVSNSGIIKNEKLIIMKEHHEGNTGYMGTKLIGEHTWIYRKIN